MISGCGSSRRCVILLCRCGSSLRYSVILAARGVVSTESGVVQRIGGRNSYADLGVGGIELHSEMFSEMLASPEGVVGLA
jgi:hypothetical protein